MGESARAWLEVAALVYLFLAGCASSRLTSRPARAALKVARYWASGAIIPR